MTEQPADSYDVDVTVEGDRFLAEVRGIPGGTYGENRAQLRQHVREVIILGADLPDDATPAFRFHYRWPEPGSPTLQPDAELFDSPEEMAMLMEDLGLTVDQVRMVRGSGLM